MGTLVGVTLYARTAAEAQAAFGRAFSRIAALNRILSDYEPESELNHLGTMPRLVSAELYTVLRFAKGLSEASGGAFDVTIGPLTRLWRKRAPMTEQARALVDWRELHLERGRAWLGRAGMRLDLGAVGKGYAADEMLRAIGSSGISRVLIAASGDIVCGDAPPGQKGWTVAAAGQRLTLRRAAVSTSGDTTQFFERDGRRYSHIIDPRKGVSLPDVLEVSIVAPNGMTADALTTTVRVMGVDAAAEVLRKYRGKLVSGGHPLARLNRNWQNIPPRR
ncbi:MAG: FAD:protein FMN transferase [Bryobacteraceae bacterium]